MNERNTTLKIENVVVAENGQLRLTGTFEIPPGRLEEVLVLLAASPAPPKVTLEQLVRHKLQVIASEEDWINPRVRECTMGLLTTLRIPALDYARLRSPGRVELIIKELSRQPESPLLQAVIETRTLSDLVTVVREHSFVGQLSTPKSRRARRR